jgi:hypothetical protein
MTLSTQLPLLKCPRTIPGTPHPLMGGANAFQTGYAQIQGGFKGGQSLTLGSLRAASFPEAENFTREVRL